MIDLAPSLPPAMPGDEHPLEPAIRLMSRVAGPVTVLVLTLAGLSILFQ